MPTDAERGFEEARALEADGDWMAAVLAWIDAAGPNPGQHVERRIVRCLTEAGLFGEARRRLHRLIDAGVGDAEMAGILRDFAIRLSRAGRLYEAERTLAELIEETGSPAAEIALGLLVASASRVDDDARRRVEVAWSRRDRAAVADQARLLVWKWRAARDVGSRPELEVLDFISQHGTGQKLIDRLYTTVLAERNPSRIAELAIVDEHVASAVFAQPQVASVAAEHAPEGTELRERLVELGEFYEAGRAEMESLRARLADPATSVAVVGNSPCERGKGHGAAIDARDLVIRFNRFSTDPEYRPDYGEKADVHWRFLWRDEGVDETSRRTGLLAVAEMQSVQQGAADWGSVVELHREGTRVAIYPEAMHRCLTRELGSRPSSGLQALWLVREARGAPLRRDEVFGFSFVDGTATGGSFHYFTDARPATGHDWENELMFFHTRILRDG